MNGVIDFISNSQIGGWFRKEIDGETVSLKLMINGIISSKKAIVSIPDNQSDESSGNICRFTFEISECDHNMASCEIEVLGSNDQSLAPSPIIFDPRRRGGHQAWELSDIDGGVRQAIEATSSSKALQRKISVLTSWFAYAIDRASALKDLEFQRLDAVRSFLESSGNLGGTLAHLMGLIQTKYPVVDLPYCEKPEVSIVIPVHNKFELTYNCIKSISSNIGKIKFEIIVVDDLSSDETILANLVFSGSFQIVRNAQNYGFVGTCNAGAERAKGNLILFLNNDTLITDSHWLDALVNTLRSDPSIGIVGSRLLFGDGKLQECGGIIWRDGSGWNWGRNSDPNDWRFRYQRDADYVSGAALMISNDLFSKLGGFDTLYSPAYYEDTDLCFRVRAAGFRVVVQPASTIVHLEGQSAGTDTGSGMKRYQIVNASKFYSRWKHVLANHQPNAVEPYRAAERYVKKSVLFIDDSILTPDKDAGSNAALQHILSIQRLGYKVIFIPAHNMAEIPPYTQQLESRGVECIYAPNFWSVEDFLRRDGRDFDFIYIHRYGNAEKYMNLCRSHRSASPIVYNVADLHSLREERAAKLKKESAAIISEGSVESNLELDLIQKADVTIVHSPFEKQFIGSKRPEATVEVVSWKVKAAVEVNSFEERNGIGFVGGFNHTPNVDAVAYFIKNIFPLVRQLDPKIEFHIVGSHMPDDFKSLDIPGIRAIGYVADVDSYVADLRLTVAPLRYGAGIKGKVLTSLAQGTPCVMSTIAAEGLNLPEAISKYVTDDPGVFADYIVRLATDGDQWSTACWEGIEFIDSEFSQEAVDLQMKAVESHLERIRAKMG